MYGQQSLKYLQSGPLEKMFADSWSRLLQVHYRPLDWNTEEIEASPPNSMFKDITLTAWHYLAGVFTTLKSTRTN